MNFLLNYLFYAQLSECTVNYGASIMDYNLYRLFIMADNRLIETWVSQLNSWNQWRIDACSFCNLLFWYSSDRNEAKSDDSSVMRYDVSIDMVYCNVGHNDGEPVDTRY